MKNTRIAWADRWLMILAIAAFPAVVAAQNAQPSRTGDPGVPVPPQERSAEIAPLIAGPTFGTSYVTLGSTDFINLYTGTYEDSGSLTVRWPVTGTVLGAQVNLPNGVTVTEIEFYVLDNNASYALLSAYLSTPATNGSFLLGDVATSGASVTVATYPVAITPYVVDSTTQRLFLSFYTPVADGTIAIAGARVGYTGAPGQLIMFPAPDRFVDTRTGRGGKSSKFVDGESYDFTISGVAGLDGNIIPAGATAVLGNVVAVSPTHNGQFKILPGGTSTTLGRASVNFNAGVQHGERVHGPTRLAGPDPGIPHVSKWNDRPRGRRGGLLPLGSLQSAASGRYRRGCPARPLVGQ